MNTIRQLGALALLYIVIAVLGLALYIALIRSPLLAGMSIMFYRGVFIAGIGTMMMLIVGLCLRARWRIDLATLVGACALSLAFNVSFLIIFPVTFDRSISMFLLARIEQQDGRLDAQALERVYVADYLGKMRQIDRRIDEQQLSGNIAVRQGRIWITPQGRALLNGARIIGGWFDADPRFVGAHPPADEQQSVH